MIETKSKIVWIADKRKISDLKPAGYNPRTASEAETSNLTESLDRFSLADPIIINKNNTIIGGHFRYRILVSKYGKNGTAVDVRVPNRLLSEEEERELNLRLNKNLGEWDLKLLSDFDEDMLAGVGFSSDEIDRIFKLGVDPADDDIPDNVSAIAKTGDIWELGGHRVMCGDSLQKSAVSALMAGNRADMLFTDPPYNIDYVGKTKKCLRILNDKKNSNDFYNFLLQAFQNMAGVCKKGGAAYICHSDGEGLNFRRAFLDAGFLLKQCIIWNKNSFVIGRQDYQWKHEPILYGWQDTDYAVWYHEPILYGWRDGEAHEYFGGRRDSTVWDIPRPQRSEEHPTMKPVELVQKAIINSSKREDIVLDLFLGAGSTVIAAEKAKRFCFGMELDPKYVDVIIKRWEDFTGKKAKKVTVK